MRSADQNFAEKDIESLDWRELLNLKRSLSSYLKELTNKLIEIDRSKMQSLNYNIQSKIDNHKLLLRRSKEVRNLMRSKNSEFLSISQKISQSKDFLSTMESRLTVKSEEALLDSIKALTKHLEDKQYGTEVERDSIIHDIKDISMKLEAIKAVKTIRQTLAELNQQADTFKDNIRVMNSEIAKLNEEINISRFALDELFKERHTLVDERKYLLNSYNTALERFEIVNSKMDKISQLRKQRVQEHGQYVDDSFILKLKDEAKRKLESGSKLTFEELKLLYNDGS